MIEIIHWHIVINMTQIVNNWRNIPHLCGYSLAQR